MQNELPTGRTRRVLRSRGLVLGSAAAVALIAGIAGGTAAWSDNPVPQSAQITQLPADQGYADLVAAVAPAVVNVSVERTVDEDEGGSGLPQGMNDPEMRRFFERFFGEMPDASPRGQERQRAHGEGSGFIIDPSGLVVTNAHVAGGADKVEVTLQDGSKLEATVKGVDEKTDLALLQIKAGKSLPFVEFGDSGKVRVGDKVLAIGNPFGLGGTVTAGIVSATGREIGQGPYEDFLQVDAPINRGNSGGPTFNLHGQVVGVNTAIYSPSGGSIGIGFAISSNLAKQIVADLEDDGRVERGWLGVAIQQIDPDIASSLGLPHAEGALVAKVEPDSPAAGAGIKNRDVIVEYAGKKIATLRDLTRAVADTDAGSKVDVVVMRDGKRESLAATIQEQKSDEQVAANDQPAADNQPKLGLALAPLSEEMRQRLGLEDNQDGVLVQRVMPNSPAESKGVRPGDVILEVGGHSVTSPQQVIDAVKSAHGNGAKSVLLLLQRNGQPTYEAIPFAAS
ncbi:MAG TPA: Do family serine endopeptidase [Geminicoccaceae bacterium]|nr:Do family serine endopeptidase [Geminicoccus sp.]HMU50959.1 Do family serine endopeptidase [Geminicoccaceae bacterium]